MTIRNSLAVLVAVGLLAPAMVAQSGGAALDTLRAQLEGVLENQRQLAAENADLRRQMGDMAATQSELAERNDSLESQARKSRDQELATHVDALMAVRAGVTVNSGANPVTMSGQLRFRTVQAWVEPQSAVADEYDGFWTDSLLRLGFQYELARDVTAFAELQSHWASGDGGTTDGGVTALGLSFGEVSTPVVLYQGWLRIDNVFSAEELSLKIGRQEVVLGNQYQFGNAEWYSGWVLDGFRADWSAGDWDLTALAMKLYTSDLDVNQLHSALGAHDDDELYSLYFTLNSIEDHTIDLYWIYVNGHGGATGGSGTSTGSLGLPVGGAGFALGSTAYYHTLGARVSGAFDGIAAGLDYNVEAAFQFGDVNGGGAVKDVDGWSVEAEVGLTFDKDSAFRAYVRFLLAAGPNDDDSGYVPLYPNRHANSGFLGRYGLLDALPMFNVVSVQGGFYFKPGDSWLVGSSVIWSTADQDTPGLDNDDWGWEVDVWAAYVYSEHLTFILAAFFVLPGDELEALVGIEDDTIVGLVFQARLLF